MTQTVVIDTCVFISYPDCVSQIKDNIIVPVVVLEELDKLKMGKEDVARKARTVIRNLDNLFEQGDPSKGIKLPGGNTIKVDASDYGGVGENVNYGDNKILGLMIANKKKKWKLISEDIALRVRAKSYGVEAEKLVAKGETNTLYTGVQEVWDHQMIQDFLENKNLSAKKLELKPNECLIFKDQGVEVACARECDGSVKAVRNLEAWGIRGKNYEQQLAMDLLMDPTIPLVSISGAAGSGKSLISLACGLELVMNRKRYNKLIILRPIETVGDGIGWLPGTASEKLAPYFAAIMDSFEFLLGSGEGKRSKQNGWKMDLEMLITKDKINLEPITFMRGRSISNTLIIVDEAQNLRPEDAKTLLTRISDSTKIIFNGDFSQIDARSLSKDQNCLTKVIDTFKDSTLAGHITLTETHRSPLAAEAIALM